MDWRFAQLISYFVNMWKSSEKHPAWMPAKDFLLKFEVPEGMKGKTADKQPDVPHWQRMKFISQMWAAAANVETDGT